MSLSTHPLGTAVHVDPEKNIQLIAAGSALISCPDHFSPPVGNSKLFDDIKAGNVWVSIDAYLQFRLSVKVHGILHPHQDSEVIFGDMAEKIGRAQFWADLDLAVTSQTYDVESHRADLGQLNIVVRVQQTPPQLSARKPVKLPSALEALFKNSGNVQPPSGVSVACLREICISLDFTSIQPSLRPIGNCLHEKGAALDDLNFDPDEEESWFQDFYSHDDTKEFAASTEHDFKPSYLKGAYSVPESDTAWESLDQDSPFSSQQSRGSHTSTSTWSELEAPQTDSFILVSLLDSGIRNIFSSSHLQKQHGIQVSPGTPRTDLVDFAPSIFDPDYRTAVTQRSRLIPSIAKGISLLVSHTESPIIKSKLHTLETSFKETYLNMPNEDMDTRSIIKCLLWRRMQGGPYRSKAGRNLTPLDTTAPFAQEQDILFASMEDEGLGSATDLFDQGNGMDDCGYDSDDSDILMDDLAADDSYGYDPSSSLYRLSDSTSELSLIFSDVENPSHDSNSPFAPPVLVPNTSSLSRTPDAHGAEELDADSMSHVLEGEVEMLCSFPARDTEMLLFSDEVAEE